MYWNHRVVDLTEENDGETWLEIKEVYYNEKDEPCGYCDSTTGGETLDELRTQVQRFAKCIEQPILNAKTDFKGKLVDDDGDTVNMNEGEW